MSWEPPVVFNFPNTKQGRGLIVFNLTNLSVEENCSVDISDLSGIAGIANLRSLPVQSARQVLKDIQKEAAVTL